MRMMKDLEGLSERCGGKPVLAADFRNWCRTERNSQRKSSPKLQREREVRAILSVEDRCRSSLGVSDGTGVGILKIEEADDGALSIV